MSRIATENKAATTPGAQGTEQGEPCPGCKRVLSVRKNRAGEAAAHWECIACGTGLTGVLLKEAAEQLVAEVRLSQRHFDTSGVPPIAPALRQLVREFSARRQNIEPTDERRKTARVPQQLDVTVLPLDENWTPLPAPILGIVVDLAPHGLGMVTAAPIPSEYIALQIRHANGLVQLLGKIAWAKDFGRGFHNAGVQFVLRFGRNEPARTRQS